MEFKSWGSMPVVENMQDVAVETNMFVGDLENIIGLLPFPQEFLRQQLY